MTDDKLMGKVLCCIPLRYYVAAVAFAFFAYGVANAAYMFMMQLFSLSGGSRTAHCVGDRCLEILSCDGLQEATMHVRMCVMIFGSLFFGGFGFMGAVNHHPPELRWLASFFHALVAIYVSAWLFDLTYSGICGRYTQNVVDLAVLWPAPNYPMREGFKFEIQVANSYPVSWVDLTAGFDVFRLYSGVIFLWCVFFVYSAYWVQVLANYSDHGVFGLGANHDVGAWREAVIFQREVASQFSDAGQMAAMTIQDVGWRANDDYVSYGAAQRDVEQNAGGKVNYRDAY